MFSNSDFGRFLYEQRPQGHAAKLTLYNYIRNFSELSHPFLPETLHRFYCKALSFDYWQKNCLELSQETQKILNLLSKTINLAPEFKKMRHPEEMQIVSLSHKEDQLQMIHNFFLSKRLNFSFKIYSDINQTAHAVLVYPDETVHVYSFDNQAIILGGNLRPLSLDRRLKYSKSLELAPNSRHHIQISPFISSKFQVGDKGLKGEYIRGYTLQAYRHFEVQDIRDELQLLYTIKKIERFFVDRASEPLYLELIQVLEQTIEFLKKSHPGALELAQKAYSRGQNALENLFVDDKMIKILLNEIHEHLRQTPENSLIHKEREWKNSSDSTNSYLNPESLAEELPTNLF